MPLYFPRPYPDELIYSLISRYKKHYGISSDKEVNLDLFGKATIASSSAIDLPYGLTLLAKHLSPQLITAEHLLNHHTLWPFYKKFIRDENIKRLKSYIQEPNKGSRLHTTLGINSSAYLRQHFLRYCPLCYQEDIEKYSEAYWHREHNIPGIPCCPKHYTRLIEPAQPYNFQSRNAYIPVEEVYQKQDIQVINNIWQIRLSLKMAQFLNEEAWIARIYPYQEKLQQLGFSRANGSLDFPLLKEQIKAVSSGLHISHYTSKDQFGWLRDLYNRSHRVFHPLRHILLQTFIEHQKPHNEKVYFGQGPWICINPVADHFQKKVIIDLKIKFDRKTQRTIGTFSCSCSMVYTKSFKDKPGQTPYFRIKAYGDTWLSKLRELITDKQPLRKISRTLHADPNTIMYQASKLGLAHPWSQKKNYQKPIKPTPNEKRGKWCTLLHEVGSVKKCRDNNQALYAWLYRNDQEWLLKKNSSYYRSKDIHSLRRKWGDRDDLILKLLIEIHQTLKKERVEQRISQSLLINRLPSGYAYVHKHLAKLPKTARFLTENTETVLAFQQRRLARIIQHAIREDLQLKPWQLKKKAGLKTNVHPTLDKMISLYCYHDHRPKDLA